MTILKQQLLFLLFMLPLFTLAQDSVQYNLLWRIEGKHLKHPSYLFGTMHVNDARAFNFSDSVMLALERCEAFALEVHPDTMMRSMFQELFNGSKGNTLMDALTEEEYQQLKQKFEEHSTLNLDEINIQSPSMLSSMMEPDEDKADDKATFVDAYLFGIARTLNKSIWGLESMKDHTDAFSNYNKEQQREFLLGLIDENYEKEYQEMLDQFVEVYKEGNITKIGTMANVFAATDSQLIRRNFIMAQSMETLMAQHSLFAAVGTAHLPGQDGIINILIQKGYQVVPVSATFTGIAQQYAIDYDQMQWYTQVDSNLGFSIDFPGQPTPLDLFEGLNTLLYVDLTNEIFLASYNIDLRGRTAQDKEELINNTVNRYLQQSNHELLERKDISMNGIDRTEVIVAQDSSKQLRMQFIYANNILYYFMIGNDAQQIKSSYAQRYYESLQLFEPRPKVDTGWTVSHLSQAAVSIAFPYTPSYQIEKSDSKSNTPAYTYHNYTANDYSSMSSYTLRYFDQPIGYTRTTSKSQVFNYIAQNFRNRNITIRKTDTIFLEGIEGRTYDLAINNKHYVRCKVYLRGARAYYLFHQNLTEGDSIIQDDAFFQSFSFKAYQSPRFETFVSQDSSFSIDFFGKPHIEKDTLNGYYTHVTNYYSDNPNSGMLHHFQVAKISNYLSIDHLDSFYNMLTTLSYGDSLISTQTITIDTILGKETVFYQRYQDRIIRQCVWLDQQRVYISQIYIDDDSTYSSYANHCINSFQSNQALPFFNPFQSKAKQLLKDLQSPDSLIRYQANRALDFYDFDTSDVNPLLLALDITYPQDSLTTALLVQALQEVADSSVIKNLTELYYQKNTNTAARVAILKTIPKLDTIKGIATYIDLLQDPTFISSAYDYHVFGLLHQYPRQFSSKYERILALAKYEPYRYYIIDFSNAMAQKDSLFAQQMQSYFSNWLPYFNVDLENYETPTKEFWQDNSPLIYKYLNFFSISNDKPFIENITEQVLRQTINPRIKAKALSIRLEKGLSPYWSKSMIRQLLKKPSYRPYLLPVLFQHEALNLIPRVYKYAPKVAKYLFYDYIRDEDAIDFVKELGKIKTAKGIFYVYEYRFLEEETSFVGIAGPFVIGKPIETYNYYNTTYTNQTPLSKDWKKDGLQLIKDFESYNAAYWD
ncbi:TraB/GumN family protein [Aureispira sp. CCB-E]|uniref:TraB/GumN family protein n=1 Tax=Aureispira sp. CCB-E TaxID=3051121 RepID=UPI0028694689|nr:TraB/GumN family protein [Aureispira sp. CCB-E]WMX13360.1 TraB/GumN family protein [Aureispira sp. CCB-E]